MAASSYEDLFNIQEHFEDAFKSYFSSSGFSPFVTGDNDDAPDDYIDIHFNPGGSAGHDALRGVTGTGELESDWFNGVLTLVIRSRRETPLDAALTGIRRKHAQDVAKIRVLMLRGKINASSDFNLDYYLFNGFELASHQNTIADDSRGIEATLLVYNIKYYIKNDAWPIA